jgi:hypothetical protein
MSKPKSERELSTWRNTKHRRALGGQYYAETRSHPRADVLDEKSLVCGEPFRIELGRTLVPPQPLVGCAVHANNHGRGYIRCFKYRSPPGDHFTVTRKYDRFGRIWRDVHRDRSPIVVIESFSYKLAALDSTWVSSDSVLENSFMRSRQSKGRRPENYFRLLASFPLRSVANR